MSETRRKTSVLLFVDNRMHISHISHYEFGKMFVTRITLSHALKKKKKKKKIANKE